MSTVYNMDPCARNLGDQFSALYQNRYCNQEDFSIAVFGGDREHKFHFKPFLLKNFDTKVYLPRPPKHQYGCEAIASGSDIYLENQYREGEPNSVELYLPSNYSWKDLHSLKVKQWFYCTCSFMQNLFIISGRYPSGKYDKSCIFYDKQSGSWNSIADIMKGRTNAACTV